MSIERNVEVFVETIERNSKYRYCRLEKEIHTIVLVSCWVFFVTPQKLCFVFYSKLNKDIILSNFLVLKVRCHFYCYIVSQHITAQHLFKILSMLLEYKRTFDFQVYYLSKCVNFKVLITMATNYLIDVLAPSMNS